MVLHFLDHPKPPMTLIRVERYFRCNGSIKNSTLIMVITTQSFFPSVFANHHLEGGCNTLVGTLIVSILSTEKTGLEAADTVLNKPGRYKLY